MSRLYEIALLSAREHSKTIDMNLEIRALEQAQKQCKLLELYIELANKIEVIDNAYGYGILGFDEIKHICEKLKELENDE